MPCREAKASCVGAYVMFAFLCGAERNGLAGLSVPS